MAIREITLPKQRVEVWPVETELSLRMCLVYVRPGGVSHLLWRILCEPGWTGQYRYTLPDSKIRLSDCPRLWWDKEEECSMPPTWQGRPFDSARYSIILPDGVEVVVTGAVEKGGG